MEDIKNYIVTRNDNEGMSFSLFILSGGRQDVIPGTTHFLEHMLVTAYEDDEKEMEKELKENGIFQEAYTTKDLIKIGHIWNNSLSLYDENVWKLSARLLGLKFDRAFNGSLFKKENIDKEKGIILNEESIIPEDHKITAKVFHDISEDYKRSCSSIIGDVKDIKKINKKALWDYVKKHIKQDNIFLTMSLPKSLPESKVEELVAYILEEWVNKIPEGETKSFLHKYQKAGHNTGILRKDLPELMEYTGATHDNIYGITDTKNLSFVEHKLLAEILNMWVFDNIREKEGLSYSAGCGAMTGFVDGKLCLSSTASKENFEAIIKAWKKKLNNLSITQKEKNSAINRLRVAYELDCVKNADLNFIEDIIVYSDFNYLKDILTRMANDPYFTPYKYYINELKDIVLTDEAREKRGLQTFRELGKYCAENVTSVHIYKKEEK